MKKLLLLSALFIFACSSDGENSTECVDFTSDMSAAEVENLISNSVYNQQSISDRIAENGQIICQGWYPENEVYGYIFEDEEWLEIQGTCVSIHSCCANDSNGNLATCDDYFGGN